MIPTIRTSRAIPPALVAGLLLCITAVACSHPPVTNEPTLANADSARVARQWAESAARADSARVVDSIAAHGEVAIEAPARVMHFESESDSLNYESNRELAAAATGYRVIVSLFDRRVFVVNGTDTLRSAPAAVAMDSTLDYAGRSWKFDTPRGKRTIHAKTDNPLWIPPDWHYAEVAKENHLALSRVPSIGVVKIANGRKLQVRHGEVGIIVPDSGWTALPLDEEVVFDDTLYMPPLGSKNRRIYGELGSYRLDMGDGYLIHGTPEESTVGDAVTHGCVRLKEEDIAWLYNNVPIGTGVYIY
ncbi:MAG: L,D-transpeptidase family protein [Gemmatimonadaceae bacterium]|nr:L,D-transpeptidase family protein [Gemmatimonadaceae bacterium]